MRLPVYANLESNEANPDGCVATLYYEELPTLEEVREFFTNPEHKRGPLRLQGPLGVDTDDEFFGFEECPNEVSKRAKLHRVQVHPTC